MKLICSNIFSRPLKLISQRLFFSHSHTTRLSHPFPDYLAVHDPLYLVRRWIHPRRPSYMPRPSCAQALSDISLQARSCRVNTAIVRNYIDKGTCRSSRWKLPLPVRLQASAASLLHFIVPELPVDRLRSDHTLFSRAESSLHQTSLSSCPCMIVSYYYQLPQGRLSRSGFSRFHIRSYNPLRFLSYSKEPFLS